MTNMTETDNDITRDDRDEIVITKGYESITKGYERKRGRRKRNGNNRFRLIRKRNGSGSGSFSMIRKRIIFITIILISTFNLNLTLFEPHPTPPSHSPQTLQCPLSSPYPLSPRSIPLVTFNFTSITFCYGSKSP